MDLIVVNTKIVSLRTPGENRSFRHSLSSAIGSFRVTLKKSSTVNNDKDASALAKILFEAQ